MSHGPQFTKQILFLWTLPDILMAKNNSIANGNFSHLYNNLQEVLMLMSASAIRSFGHIHKVAPMAQEWVTS